MNSINYDIGENEDSLNDSDTWSQDGENQPSGAECLARCKKFAEITGTDTALAMFYLQDNKWDLQKGLDRYLKATNNKESKVVACFDVETLDNDERFFFLNSNLIFGIFKFSKITNSEKQKNNIDSSECSENQSEQPVLCEQLNDDEEKNENNHFKILSWNIDGLDSSNLESRTLGVISKIEK